jgi:hypothetical protein
MTLGQLKLRAPFTLSRLEVTIQAVTPASQLEPRVGAALQWGGTTPNLHGNIKPRTEGRHPPRKQPMMETALCICLLAKTPWQRPPLLALLAKTP